MDVNAHTIMKMFTHHQGNWKGLNRSYAGKGRLLMFAFLGAVGVGGLLREREFFSLEEMGSAHTGMQKRG